MVPTTWAWYWFLMEQVKFGGKDLQGTGAVQTPHNTFVVPVGIFFRHNYPDPFFSPVLPPAVTGWGVGGGGSQARWET